MYHLSSFAPHFVLPDIYDNDDDEYATFLVHVLLLSSCHYYHYIKTGELLCKSPAADSYTTMCELWKNSETVNSNEGVSMTVFIPTDDAFATLSDLLDQADVELDIEANEKILMFHATPGMVLSTHLDCTGTLEMFDGGSSRTKCGKANQVDYLIQKGSGNRKNDMEPIIIAADIMACDNSVIHIVSEVLLPNFIEDFGLN